MDAGSKEIIHVESGAVVHLPFAAVGLVLYLDEAGNLVIVSGTTVVVIDGYAAAKDSLIVLDADNQVVDLNPASFETPDLPLPPATDDGPAHHSGGHFLTPFATAPQFAGQTQIVVSVEPARQGAEELASAQPPLLIEDEELRWNLTEGSPPAFTASDVSISVDEDGGPVSAVFRASDSAATFDILGSPAAGTLTDNGDGTFTFDPGSAFEDLSEGEIKTETFAYEAKAQNGQDSDSATVTIIFHGINDVPVADDVTLTATEHVTSVTGSFDADDIDSDDNPGSLTYVLLGAPANLVDNGDGTFTIAPDADLQSLGTGDTVTVSFSYQALDSHGDLSAPATVTITVAGVNDAPEATNVTATATDGGGLATGSFSATDIDDDPATLSFVIDRQPAQGSVVNNGDGTFSFNPGTAFQSLAAGQAANVTFTYHAVDPDGAHSNIATATIMVTGVNNAPTVKNLQLAEVAHGTPITHRFSGDDIDSDDSGSTIAYALTSLPAQGSLINNNNGTFSFDPGTDFDDLGAADSRAVSFTYAATDSHGLVSSSATVQITVFGVDTAPIASDLTISTTEDHITTLAFPATDHEDVQEELIYNIITGPAQGTVTVNGDGTFSFDPGAALQSLPAGVSTSVNFTYQATDEQGMTSNVGAITININGANEAPTVAAIAATVAESAISAPIAFNGDDVDSNDGPSTLTYTVTSQPVGGNVVNNGDGTFSFDPENDFGSLGIGQTKDATFTYVATDSHGAQSAEATVTITVTGETAVPVAENVFIPNAAFLASFVYTGGTAAGEFIGPTGSARQWIQGLGGDDDIYGSGSADLLEGGDGNDLVDGFGGNDILLGGLGNDNLYGNSGNDAVEGGAGNDTIDGASGNDELYGGSGNDLMAGGDGNDTLQGGGGDDWLSGGAGNDTLRGGAGNDHMVGGAGDDNYDLSDGGNTVYYTELGNGLDHVLNFDGDPTGGRDLVNIDNLFDTLELTLGPLNEATRRNMVILQTAGGVTSILIDDDQDPGTAAVEIMALQSADPITVGSDILVDVRDDVAATDFAIPTTLDTYLHTIGTGARDVLEPAPGNSLNQWIQGQGGNDDLRGSRGADLIEGGGGDDYVLGWEANDIIIGGAGNDNLNGMDGDDQIEGDGGNDTIRGDAGNDDLRGDAGNDTLLGGAGNDFLDGGNGVDRLTGGAGNDRIDASSGDDTIFYTGVGDGLDEILGFDANPASGKDVFNLDGLFDSLQSTLGPLDTATRTGMVSLSTVNDVTSVFVDTDLNAGTAPVQIATIQSLDAITVGAAIVVG